MIYPFDTKGYTAKQPNYNQAKIMQVISILSIIFRWRKYYLKIKTK